LVGSVFGEIDEKDTKLLCYIVIVVLWWWLGKVENDWVHVN